MSLPVHLVPSLVGVQVGATVEVDGRRGAPRGRRTTAAGGGVGRADRRRRHVGRRRGRLDRQARLRGHRRRRCTVDPVPVPSVVVVQAIPKGDRGELAVEVLTEVGVGRGRAVGGRALGRGLEGRARRQGPGPLALDRPRGGQAGPPDLAPRRRAARHHRRGGPPDRRGRPRRRPARGGHRVARRPRGPDRRPPAGGGRPRGWSDRRGDRCVHRGRRGLRPPRRRGAPHLDRRRRRRRRPAVPTPRWR